MQAFRKIVNPRQILRAAVMPAMRPGVRAMSLYLDREKGEESKYIRAREDELNQQARANLERILAMENTAEEKVEILAQLGKIIISRFFGFMTALIHI